MTSFVETPGVKKVYDKELTSAAEVTLVEAKTGNSIERTLETIWVTSDGTSSALTIKVKNGSNTLFKIIDNYTVTQSFQITGYPRPLRPEHSITVEAGTANALWISAVMVEKGSVDGGR